MKLKHYLIASEFNDYSPWVLTPQALGLFCLVIWGFRFIVPASITLAAGTIDASDLMNKINQERSQRFLTTLTTNDKLITAAHGKASDMLSRSYFSHVDPDGNFVWPRIEATGYRPYVTLGENLAMDFTKASDVINAWMNSPTHRENIVNSKFEDQGLSTASGLYEPNHDTIIVVSLFGKLAVSSSAPSPTPPPAAKPTPPPAAVPPSASNKQTAVPITISKDLKISTSVLSGHKIVDISLNITGATLVTAKLKTQLITLLKGQTAGEFIGSFTFDQPEDLTNQSLTVEARRSDGTKVTQNFPVSIAGTTTDSQPNQIPVSKDASMMKFLKYLFLILASAYLLVMVIDSIIQYRHNITRDGLKTAPHLVVFAILIIVSLFLG